jgi:hypothetical protein
MPPSSIDVRLSRLKLMNIDDCDSDDALDAIMDAVEAALTKHYPDSTIAVTWQAQSTDPECDILVVVWDDGDEGDHSEAEAGIASLVERAEGDAVRALFDVDPAPWTVWRAG